MQRLLRQTFFIIMRFSEFYKFIESHNWHLEGGTNHYRYAHPDFDYSIPVGRHPSQEIGPWLLDKMLRETGLKEAYREWRKRKKK